MGLLWSRTMIGTGATCGDVLGNLDERRHRRVFATSLNGAPGTRSSRARIMARARGPPKIDNPDYVRADFISCFKRCHSSRTGRPPDLIARGAPIWRFWSVPFSSFSLHNACLSQIQRGPIFGNDSCDKLQAVTKQSYFFRKMFYHGNYVAKSK